MRVACWSCDNWLGPWSCLAFPDGIPEDIKSGKNLHDKEIEGDNGYRFSTGKTPKLLKEEKGVSSHR